MSEYTPTEARICIDFCNAATKRAQADGSFMSMEEADAAFSRWLAAHDAEVRAGVVAEEPEWETTTERGFGITTIPVANYRGMAPVDFTVQMSSLATEAKVWIGVADHRAHMNVEEATRARDALSAFLSAVAQEGQVDR